MKKSNYSKILAAHEIRMWLGQIIIPGALAVGVLSQTEFGQKIGRGFKKTKEKIKGFFIKKKK